MPAIFFLTEELNDMKYRSGKGTGMISDARLRRVCRLTW
ncbi:MAG TPA: hypothetical protein DEB17_05970 [Chlorobaculum sp.]|uniref:Uncharacterized protein n=1 Tax=Chlorobaculum tepidum (strain ATCC 49652 / DSM 12025 / NBRC 103806 / TLS) TaxID=194439 RepID=Q8KF66_CHLTE|nr:hypothetical protein CT0465 [Chlorobaculum tepidum TLS]HBU23529.1 hypothetical protein [Chlorobaculum sp.]